MSPRLPIALVAASVVAALLPSSALAWKHTEKTWLPEDMPIIVRVADDGADNSIDACEASFGESGCCEESVPAGYCYESARDGFDYWMTAPCAEFEVDVRDGTTDPDEVAPNIGYTFNGLNAITFNDPGTQIAETGTLAVTLTYASGTAAIINGVSYAHIDDGDIVFNEDVEFATDQEIIDGNCGGRSNFHDVMTHEIGHFLGMDHSCEDPGKGGAPCTDPVLLEAIMFWSEGACETKLFDKGYTLLGDQGDDLQGITALYGPFATFSCSHEVSDDQAVGVVPFDLNCVVVSDYLGEVTGASWNFGDGGTAESLTPTHTYTEPGNYTIQVDVQGERQACGEDGWSNTYRKVGYVRACGEPDAAFEVVHDDGLKYQMLNDSDVSVYGCISDIQWDVFAGDKPSGKPIMDPIKAWEPIIEFPEPGTYTVVMSLGGIAGTGGATVTFEAKNRRGNGYGCSTVAPAGGVAGLLLVGGLLAVRRRK